MSNIAPFGGKSCKNRSELQKYDKCRLHCAYKINAIQTEVASLMWNSLDYVFEAEIRSLIISLGALTSLKLPLPLI